LAVRLLRDGFAVDLPAGLAADLDFGRAIGVLSQNSAALSGRGLALQAGQARNG